MANNRVPAFTLNYVRLSLNLQTEQYVMKASTLEFELPLSAMELCCSDHTCDCQQQTFSEGEGYLYISHYVVAYNLHSFNLGQTNLTKCKPVLLCKLAAEKRQLNIEIAQRDAHYWWEHYKAPFRATPLANNKFSCYDHSLPKVEIVQISGDTADDCQRQFETLYPQSDLVLTLQQQGIESAQVSCKNSNQQNAEISAKSKLPNNAVIIDDSVSGGRDGILYYLTSSSEDSLRSAFKSHFSFNQSSNHIHVNELSEFFSAYVPSGPDLNQIYIEKVVCVREPRTILWNWLTLKGKYDIHWRTEFEVTIHYRVPYLMKYFLACKDMPKLWENEPREFTPSQIPNNPAIEDEWGPVVSMLYKQALKSMHGPDFISFIESKGFEYSSYQNTQIPGTTYNGIDGIVSILVRKDNWMIETLFYADKITKRITKLISAGEIA